MSYSEPIPSTGRRLPLWKTCVEKMKTDGITYGSVYTVEFFETELGEARGSMDFELAVSNVRRALEHDGFYLTGRGGGGASWKVVPPENNVGVMQSYSQQAADCLARGVILGTNTPLSTLKEADRKRHEAILERMAMKALLLKRAVRIAKVVRKHDAKALAEG